MKKKQKDDILGEDQSNLPVQEGEEFTIYLDFPGLTCDSSWWLSQRTMRIEEGILFSAADSKCRRASYNFLQGAKIRTICNT